MASTSTSSAAAPARIAVLLSGRGSNLQAIIDACERGEVAGRICQVLSDQPTARGLERARHHGIAAETVEFGRFASRDAFEAALSRKIAAARADLIVLAGFMRILGGRFIADHAGRILNIHPSLLPKFKGLDTHRRAIEAGETWHGASVHFVTEELDGGPVVARSRVRIGGDDTAESLAGKVLEREHVLYPRVVDWFCRGWLAMRDGRAVLRDEPLTKPLTLDADGALETP